MNFQIAADTDAGTVKSVNQDSICCKRAIFHRNIPVALAAVCDGMGGLSSGELASAKVVTGLGKWFAEKLPQLLTAASEAELAASLEEELYKANQQINEYGKSKGISLGTTVTAFLGIGPRYLIVHVGDSRVYLLRGGLLQQLTKDHSFVQREIEAGRLRKEDAEASPKRNVLLQCVGASSMIEPQRLWGDIKNGDAFLLCSDGFRHEITENEIVQSLSGHERSGRPEIQGRLRGLIELVKQRGERDNISAVLVQAL